MSTDEIREAGADEIARFGRKLVEAGIIGSDAESVLDYFEAPWKWGLEYRLWTRLERPADDDEAWDGFVELSLRGNEAIRLYLFEFDA